MIARYQILEHLGTAADAHLYRARYVDSGKPAMLKRFDPANVSTVTPAHFRDEYALLQSLDIAGIIKPVALFNEGEYLTMTLDALDDFAGESLEFLLERHPRMEWLVCVDIASQLAQTLAGVHAARIIHRDIRPANILVARESHRVLLADFSIATRQDQAFSSDGRAARPADWAYLSPEQTGRMNRTVDYRTDFYSLGITLYRMLTGCLPFAANDPLEWTHCHVARIPPPPCDIAPDVPQPVSDIVMKLLAKLPEDRYQSMRGVQADLDRCLAQWRAAGRVDVFPLGEEDVSDRFQIPRKLYGRDQERTTLLAAFDRMATSGQSTLVTVSGYLGIGKSALVGELHQPIVAKRGYFIAGKFDQYQRDIPYATLTQAFRDLVQQLLAESEERIASWRQQIQAAVGINGQLIVDVLPQVALIIGPQAPVSALPPAEAQNRFRLVFQRFLAVFSSPEHPLTLFLDDMQWADAASLQFIEHLLTQPDTRFLLLIAAYRDNEINAAHPLTSTLEAIRHDGATMIDLQLAPLTILHLNQLVADTLHVPSSSCEPLTRVIFERTEGNPFFFTQFFDALHKEGVLRHDPQEHAWRWDLAQIKSRDFADNVADLIAGKLRRLPQPAQETLQLAACLGNKFNLRHLALVSGLTEDETGQRLSAAVREDLILCADGHGKFLHDRIQQAAYALIPEARHAEVYLHIGRTLVAHMTADEIDRHLFDLANQFIRGAALLIDPDEKARVAGIHLRAGRKAKASVAYASACGYLSAGMALFDDQDWKSRYELLFCLWLDGAECELLRGDFDTAERRIATLLRTAASKLDQAAAYRLKIELHTIKAENTQAIETALACLRGFGIDLPAHPTPDQVQSEYEQVWQALGERQIESLIDLPLATDPEILAAMDILAAMGPVTIMFAPPLYFLLICRLMTLSLRHGITGVSAWACSGFGLMLSQSYHRYVEGDRFSKLGCELVDKHDFAAYKTRTYLTAMVNAPWIQPLNVMFELGRVAFQTGDDIGDLRRACGIWANILQAQLLQGVPLDAVWRESEKGLAYARQVKYQDNVDNIVSLQRFIASLQGQTARLSSFDDVRAGPDASDGNTFDEAAFEAKLGEDRSPLLVHWYWLVKMQACFLSGDHVAAFVAARRTKALLWTVVGQPLRLLNYHYYAALIMAALYEDAPANEQREWRELLLAHQAQLREWAQNCAPTFHDKFVLVSAEIARLEGRDLEAMRLYEQAIQLARENGFVHNEAIASELAAGFYLARGFAPASNGYLEQARDCYARWGADGKVRQLEERYPQLRARTMHTPATFMDGETQLDMLSVTKASQAISGRIVLNEVIDTLMRITVENAGAQTGFLLLAHHDDLVLAAEANVEQQTVQVLLYSEQTPPGTPLPTAILNYVRRSREPVLLMDAAAPHPFSADPYFAQRHPKSVLCLPILRQSALIGLLYLENNLATHAFPPGRVKVLELLASQAAISLENARLYTDVQQENVERKRAEEALREREARIRQLVESNIIGIFFFDLHGGISDANDALLHMLGYSRDDLLSGTLQWTVLTPATYRALDEQKAAEVRATGKCTPYEKEYIRKDGSLVPVLVGAALLEGSQEHGVAFVLDLTAHRQAEAERAARKSAEAANTAKSAFLANMSHELRTPLNGILGYAQILQHDQTLDERQLAGVNVIRQSGEHLLTLINDILDLAKIEAGKMELYLADFQLATFARTIVEIIGVKAAQKDLEFICDLAPDLPRWIRADEKRLRQVLLNLLSNAVKFTDHGHVALRVRAVSPSRLRFDVQDTGVGIDANQLDTIFQPFEQVGEEQRRLGGTGLGLAISRQYVRLMGGDIQVESRPGQGSTFWFELEAPVVAIDTAAAPARIVTGYAGPRKKVLVVDDVAENRTVVTDLLTPLGFEVVAAVNGREGLEMAQRLRPHLILTDIAMPEMDGLEATRRLRQLAAFKDVSIIALSASVSVSDSEKCLAAGMNAFLPKPINVDRLLSQIGTVLQLEWIYGQKAELSSELDASEAFVVPPLEEMEVLYRLARRGNMQDILAQASYLAELDQRYGPFARKLRLLAKSYQSKAILSLVERCLNGIQVQ